MALMSQVHIALFCVFFFSSRRRHTRFDCDWSSDVCSSDLRRHQRSAEAGLDRTQERVESDDGLPGPDVALQQALHGHAAREVGVELADRARSEERRVGKSVDLGGRRIIKKKKIEKG